MTKWTAKEVAKLAPILRWGSLKTTVFNYRYLKYSEIARRLNSSDTRVRQACLNHQAKMGMPGPPARMMTRRQRQAAGQGQGGLAPLTRLQIAHMTSTGTLREQTGMSQEERVA